jgi:hypothetical protein
MDNLKHKWLGHPFWNVWDSHPTAMHIREKTSGSLFIQQKVFGERYSKWAVSTYKSSRNSFWEVHVATATPSHHAIGASSNIGLT